MNMALAALVGLAFLILQTKRSGKACLPESPWRFALMWVGLFTVEYWLLGPSSYLWMDDEGDLLVPFYQFMTGRWDGAQYLHGLNGGADAGASFVIGGEFLSLDRSLISILPLWLAVLVHKAIVCAIGFAGTYGLARLAGLSRGLALGAAALFTVAHFRLVIVTFGTGLSWSVAPFAAWLLLRDNDRWYWPSVLALSLLAAITVIPSQGGVTLPAVVITMAVFLGRAPLRAVVGLALVLVAIICNWAESLVGMISLAALSPTGGKLTVAAPTLAEVGRLLVGHWINVVYEHGIAIWLWATGLTLIAVFARRALPRHLLVFICPFVLILGFLVFPWQLIGLQAVRGLTYNYMVFALVPAGVLTLAKGLAAADGALPSGTFRPRASAVLLAVALAATGWWKLHALGSLTGGSSQVVYGGVRTYEPSRPWRQGEPFRSVTLRDKGLVPEPNVAWGTYGVDAFDGFVNFPLHSFSQYMRQGVFRSAGTPQIMVDWAHWDTGRLSYDFQAQADLDLLAAANVRWVIAPVPLAEGVLRLVEGPDQIPPRRLPRPSGLSARAEHELMIASWKLSRLYDYGAVYVYEIPEALPRVWPVQSVRQMADDSPVEAVLDEIRATWRGRTAVIRASDAARLGSPAPLTVRRWEQVANGFRVEVEAPRGGLLAINALHYPYFTARVDGRPAELASANMVQMVIAVPPGGQEVTVSYSRPTLGGGHRR